MVQHCHHHYLLLFGGTDQRADMKGHGNDQLHCREIHFLPIWANTVNKPHGVEAAKRQRQKSKFGRKKTLLLHSRMLHDFKTVIGTGSDFDQETAEKIAPQFIARLELANCMFYHLLLDWEEASRYSRVEAALRVWKKLCHKKGQDFAMLWKLAKETHPTS